VRVDQPARAADVLGGGGVAEQEEMHVGLLEGFHIAFAAVLVDGLGEAVREEGVAEGVVRLVRGRDERVGVGCCPDRYE